MLSLVFWEWAEYGSVVAIFLGVVGEYVADFVLSDETNGDKSKKTRLSKASTLVLIAGLALELPAIWQINGLTGEKATILERDASVARAEAESARADIAAANARAKIAEAQIAEAGKQATEASTKAAEANARAGEAKKGAASSLVVAEKERLERTRLEAEVSPRRLSPEQRLGIAAACRRFAGHQVDVRTAFQTDLEAVIIARQIAESLAQAGLEVKFSIAPHFLTGTHIGVEVFPGDGEPELASVIVHSLVK